MKTLRLNLIAAAVLAACAGLAEAQAFTNGSFEPTAPGQFVNGGDDRMNNTAAPGWAINNGSPDWMFGPGVTLWDTLWGDYFQVGGGFTPPTGIGGTIPPNLPIALREGIGQSVSGFTPGSLYTISYNHTNGLIENPPMSGAPGGWELFIDGTSVFFAPSTNTIGTFFPLPHTTDWQSSSFTFQATNNTHQFDFMAYGPGLPTAASLQWLDNVSVQPVPEPASLAVFGLSGLVMLRRRQNGFG